MLNDIDLVINGHCDTRGSSAYNFALGDRRAWAVKKWIASFGIEPECIKCRSFGEEYPICDIIDPDEQCHSMNRRCEIEAH